MDKKILIRKFIFDGEELPDPGLLLSPEEVRKYYATKYPELTNALIEQKIDDKKQNLIITFNKTLGTKG